MAPQTRGGTDIKGSPKLQHGDRAAARGGAQGQPVLTLGEEKWATLLGRYGASQHRQWAVCSEVAHGGLWGCALGLWWKLVLFFMLCFSYVLPTFILTKNIASSIAQLYLFAIWLARYLYCINRKRWFQESKGILYTDCFMFCWGGEAEHKNF